MTISRSNIISFSDYLAFVLLCLFNSYKPGIRILLDFRLKRTFCLNQSTLAHLNPLLFVRPGCFQKIISAINERNPMEKYRYTILFLFLFFLFCGHVVQGQEITLPQIIDSALQTHPELKSMANLVKAREGANRQTRAVPNLEIGGVLGKSSFRVNARPGSTRPARKCRLRNKKQLTPKNFILSDSNTQTFCVG